MKLNQALLKLASLLQAYKAYIIDEELLSQPSLTPSDWYGKVKKYYYKLDSNYFEQAGIVQNEWYFRKLLHYEITREISKTAYSELDKFRFPEEETHRENIVSSFFFFMWNAWCKEECRIIFGWEFQHFWDKWCGMCKRYNVYSATENYYADLTQGNRVKLVNRACEIYNGSERRKKP